MAMAAIKSLGVDTVDMPQTSGKISVWGLNQEVVVVGQETIGGNPKMPEFTSLLHSLEKDLVILWVPENRFPPASAVQDMIPGIGEFDPKRPRHELTIFEKVI